MTHLFLIIPHTKSCRGSMHIFSDLSVSQSVLTISLMTHHLFNRSNDIAKLGSHTSQ